MIVVASYDVIGDAGRSIVELLRSEMTPNHIAKKEMIELVSPENLGDYNLILYLYSIKEKLVARNSLEPSDLSLELFYLMTTNSNADKKAKAYDEHCLLGKAMKVLSENNKMIGSKLYGSLAKNNEELKITLQNISSDDLSKIWMFPNTPYRLSVAYVVGPVFIDSNIESKEKITMVSGK